MEVAIIEATEEGNLNVAFQKEVHAAAEGVNFTVKKASDMFNALAYARKLSAENKILVLICELSKTQEENEGFFTGLANFQAETGKRVYKLLFKPDEGMDIIEFANNFIDAEFKRKREKAEAKEQDILDVV